MDEGNDLPMVSVDGDDLETMCEIEEQLFCYGDPLLQMEIDHLFDGGYHAISEGEGCAQS